MKKNGFIYTFLKAGFALALSAGLFFAAFSFAKDAMIPEGKPYSMKDKIKEKKGEKKSSVALITAGWVEKICIGASENLIKAKLDTGAAVSSIDAQVIKFYKKDDKKYVLYRVTFDEGGTETFKSEVLRYTRIKARTGEKPIRRPVVMMKFKIGDHELYEEVNLADREHFVYPVLIGRNMLEGNIIVDSAATFKVKTRCKSADAE